jgi:hypothetical protein
MDLESEAVSTMYGAGTRGSAIGATLREYERASGLGPVTELERRDALYIIGIDSLRYT